MEYCKLQTGCLLVVAYIAFLYVRERRERNLMSRS